MTAFLSHAMSGTKYFIISAGPIALTLITRAIASAEICRKAFSGCTPMVSSCKSPVALIMRSNGAISATAAATPAMLASSETSHAKCCALAAKGPADRLVVTSGPAFACCPTALLNAPPIAPIAPNISVLKPSPKEVSTGVAFASSNILEFLTSHLYLIFRS